MTALNFLTVSGNVPVSCTSSELKLMMSDESRSLARALDKVFGVRAIIVEDKIWLHPKNNRTK